MKAYEMENPTFFQSIEETVCRKTQPYQLHLSEITQDELIYLEQIENPYLDKRKLAAHQYTYRKYVFNMNSFFMNYLFLNQHTRFLFLFRRLNTCRHKHSCLESILRKVYEVVACYGVVRLPLYWLMS